MEEKVDAPPFIPLSFGMPWFPKQPSWWNQSHGPRVWKWLIVLFLVGPGLYLLLFGRAALVQTSIVAVTMDSSGDFVVEVRLRNVSNQEVSIPGQSADFLFYEVIAPGIEPKGLVAWCGNAGMNYTTLSPGKTLSAKALIDSELRDTPLQVAFFREGAPSNLAQTASAVSDQVPMGQRFRVWINQWSQQRRMIYSPRFVPRESAE